jgi:hypothetical protein
MAEKSGGLGGLGWDNLGVLGLLWSEWLCSSHLGPLLKANPQGDGIWRGGLLEVIRSFGLCPHR